MLHLQPLVQVSIAGHVILGAEADDVVQVRRELEEERRQAEEQQRQAQEAIEAKVAELKAIEAARRQEVCADLR